MMYPINIILSKVSNKTQCLIRKLPMEIVNNILSYTSSDSASLIRQSKFYQTPFSFLRLQDVFFSDISNPYLLNDMRILNKEVMKAGYPYEDDYDYYIEENDYSGDEEYDYDQEYNDYDQEWYPPILYL